MSAYYNDNDPAVCTWLRELIASDLIAPGDVDERPIQDVAPASLVSFNQCHFFAGIGGWSRALRLAGWPDDRRVWTGSCPCQPFSAAGKRKGFDDKRHLWPEWFRLIRECRPDVVFGEQVAGRDGLAWLDAVYADLESIGYAVGAVDLPACGVGAPHRRQRLWFVADAEHAERRQETAGMDNGDRQEAGRDESASLFGERGPTNGFWRDAIWLQCRDGKARAAKPEIFPLAHGLPGRVGLLRGVGNAIAPQAAAEVIKAYMDYAGSTEPAGD